MAELEFSMFPSHYSFSETTLPHLEVTLNIDWQKIGEKFLLPPNEFQDQKQRLSKISKRCGKDALKHVTKLSNRNRVINFQTLQSVQCFVLGKGETNFRTTNAFCAKRNERYAYFQDLSKVFKIKLHQDAGDEAHPLAKAARLYLDIIFVHPFIDGNARSAMLATTFYCLKHGYNAPNPNELFSFEFDMPNETKYAEFCDFLAKNVGGL